MTTQKDVDVRWTLKIGGKIRYRSDDTSLPQIALPVFAYKSRIAIDRRVGFIHERAVTSASQADGRMLPRLETRQNTCAEIWAFPGHELQRVPDQMHKQVWTIACGKTR